VKGGGGRERQGVICV
jgi:hypothetical protein